MRGGGGDVSISRGGFFRRNVIEEKYLRMVHNIRIGCQNKKKIVKKLRVSQSSIG